MVGQVGISPEVFPYMTYAECYYAWLGFAAREAELMRSAWERERASTCALINIQLQPKDRQDAAAMWPLPWDRGVRKTKQELTLEERRRRAEAMVKGE